MKPDRLERMFCVIGDTPEAIAGLRKLVVALAVSDKLGNSADEGSGPQGLMERIDQRKQELVRSGGLQKGPPTHPVTEEELPRGLPLSARMVRLRAVAKIEKGPTGIAKAKPGPFPLVVTAEERASCDHFDFDGAAAIIPLVSSTGHGKASLHRLHYQEGRFALGSILAAVFPYAPEVFSARFIFEYLSAFKGELLVSRMIGTANVSLSIGKVGDVPVPLIAPSAQARVDELMALCDRLEAARNERESRRDRLVAASLHRLGQPAEADDADAFRANARFYFNHLPRLTTRPYHIKQLRQTILNLAVRGRLVPQDPTDEPASELSKRILAQPWTRKRKTEEIQPDQQAVAAAFPLPRGWEWSSVNMLVRPNETVTYGILKPEWVAKGVPTVRVTEMKTGTIDINTLPKCDPARASKFAKTTLTADDLLISKDGTIGKTAFVPPELAGGNITQHMLRFPITPLVDRFFVRISIDAPFCQSWMAGETKGVALQGVNVGDFRRMLIPLPPLAEQHRIVAKVHALIALCDRLETSLAETEADSRRLLEGVLHEALEPAETALEAAE